MRTNRVRIGRIVGVHGIRGEIKILALTDNPARFLDMRSLSVYRSDGTPQSELTIESVRLVENKGLIVARVKEISDRDSAEEAVGGYVEIPPGERYQLEEGAFWIDDLLEMAVLETGSDVPLGVLSDIISQGENDLYVVKDEKGKDHYIPAVKEFIAGVDLDKREIRISLIEGLWES